MKKLLFLALVSVTMLFTSSCSDVEIQSQPVPPLEEEWGKTLKQWYPDWQEPKIVNNAQ